MLTPSVGKFSYYSFQPKFFAPPLRKISDVSTKIIASIFRDFFELNFKKFDVSTKIFVSVFRDFFELTF